MTTCELCWAKFGTEDDMAQHVEMEETVDWPIDGMSEDPAVA